MRTPDGSVAKAFEGTGIEVNDQISFIELKLTTGKIIKFHQDFRKGADGGMYREIIVSVDGEEIAWR